MHRISPDVTQSLCRYIYDWCDSEHFADDIIGSLDLDELFLQSVYYGEE